MGEAVVEFVQVLTETCTYAGVRMADEVLDVEASTVTLQDCRRIPEQFRPHISLRPSRLTIGRFTIGRFIDYWVNWAIVQTP